MLMYRVQVTLKIQGAFELICTLVPEENLII